MAGMFCTNCGSPLAGNEKFCPVCGAPVRPVPAPAQEPAAAPEKKQRRRFQTEPFEWNLDGYPAYAQEDVESEDKPLKEETPADFAWTDVQPVQSHMDLPHYRKLDGEEDEREAELNASQNVTQPEISPRGDETAAQQERFRDGDDRDAAAVTGAGSPGAVSAAAEPSDTVLNDSGTVQAYSDTGARYQNPGQIPEGPFSGDDIVWGEIPGKPLFDEEEQITLPEERTPEEDAALTDENVRNNVEKIDKFYTSSKKNEEFQALLEREYSRLMGDVSKKDDGGLIDPFAEKSAAENREQVVSGAGQIPQGGDTTGGAGGEAVIYGPENAAANVAGDGSGIFDSMSAPGSSAETGSQGNVPGMSSGIQNPDKTGAEVYGDEGAGRRRMTDKQQKDFDEVFHGPTADEEPEKHHTFMKVLAIIIFIFIILEIIVIVLKWQAPESVISLKIQEIYNMIFETVRGWFG